MHSQTAAKQQANLGSAHGRDNGDGNSNGNGSADNGSGGGAGASAKPKPNPKQKQRSRAKFAKFRPRITPPQLAGQRVGVFSTRTPHRFVLHHALGVTSFVLNCCCFGLHCSLLYYDMVANPRVLVLTFD